MLESLLYDETDILERVDEYSLYCLYLEYQPLIGGKSRSPIRPDDSDPSFGVYVKKYGQGVNEFMWKDQSIGVHGDIFDLVGRLYSLNRRSAMHRVCFDTKLGGREIGVPTITHYEPKYLDDIDIRVNSRAFSYKDFAYWRKYNVNAALLRKYNIAAIEAYWLTKKQSYPNFPKGLGFSYRIWDKYQLYFPFEEKKRKFRNDWTPLCVPGFQQLTFKKPLCIITKAMKDVTCLASFGYETVAPRGENILLPEECIDFLAKKYQRVVTLFDNDGKHKGNEYPFEELHVPIESGQKDPTDYCASYGPEKTQEMLSVLLTK